MPQNKSPNLLQDNFGREIDYIRISVTDRCNLRCLYCMPPEGMPYMAHDEIISYEEIVRIVKIMAENGLRKVKLTGGEPLVRPELYSLVAMLKQIPRITDVTLTTNGLLLKQQMNALYDAGIRSINISIDAMDAGLQKQVSHSDQTIDIQELVDFLLEYPDIKLKLNVVPIKGVNDAELPKLAELARDKNISVRFIELMPIGLGKKMQFLGEDEIKEMLLPVTGELSPMSKKLGYGPCSYYSAAGFVGNIGFISAVSHKFCDSCNRVRIASNGYLKTCLQYDIGEGLLEPLRAGADDRAILQLIKTAIAQKPKEHRFGSTELTDGEQKTMSQIGG